MQATSNPLRAYSARRLVVKLAVATALVAITAAIALNDRPAPTGAARAALASEGPHAPLSETASTSASDLPDATAPVADATSSRP